MANQQRYHEDLVRIIKDSTNKLIEEFRASTAGAAKPKSFFDDLNKELEKYSGEPKESANVLAHMLAQFNEEYIQRSLFEPIFVLVDYWVNDLNGKASWDIANPETEKVNIERNLGVYIAERLPPTVEALSKKLVALKVGQNVNDSLETNFKYSGRTILKNAHDKVFVAKYRAPILEFFIRNGFEKNSITTVMQRFPWTLFEVNEHSDAKATAYHWAIEVDAKNQEEQQGGESSNVLKFLLDQLAKYTVENKTPKRFLDVMCLRNAQGLTALDFAVRLNKADSVKTIINAFANKPDLRALPNWQGKILTFDPQFVDSIFHGCADSISALLKYKEFGPLFADRVYGLDNETPLKYSLTKTVDARQRLIQKDDEAPCIVVDYQKPEVLKELYDRLRVSLALIRDGRANPQNPTKRDFGKTAKELFVEDLNFKGFRDFLTELSTQKYKVEGADSTDAQQKQDAENVSLILKNLADEIIKLLVELEKDFGK
jgi:hypothetical protein